MKMWYQPLMWSHWLIVTISISGANKLCISINIVTKEKWHVILQSRRIQYDYSGKHLLYCTVCTNTNTNTNTNNLFLTARYMIQKVQCIKIHYWVLVIRMRFVGGNYEFSGGWGCKWEWAARIERSLSVFASGAHLRSVLRLVGW